jgi:vacuolar protein sorting-associated protein 3
VQSLHNMSDEANGPASKRHLAALEPGPYVLRPLLTDVPLSTDGGNHNIKITCVDYLGMGSESSPNRHEKLTLTLHEPDRNLYIGTSAGEVLHFFQIPPEPSDPSGTSSFIQALRLRPPYADPPGITDRSALPGIQQILLLPRVGKACVLCNWTVTFYSLPELAPVFNGTQVGKCNWVGGVDLNLDSPGDGGGQNGSTTSRGGTEGTTVLLSLNRRLQAVRIGDEIRALKNIDFAASLVSVRRDNIACVADARSYALIDVDRQLKIPLMAISSLDAEAAHAAAGGVIGQAQDIGGGDGSLSRSASTAVTKPSAVPKEMVGHGRSTSLGGLMTGLGSVSGSPRRQDKKGADRGESPAPSGRSESPANPRLSHDGQRQEHNGLDRPELRTSLDQSRRSGEQARTALNARPTSLKPHIVSPSAEEFLLVTGTGPDDAGIGMFVNLDGDPTRPTVEFERYPYMVVVDGAAVDLSASRRSLEADDEGYVLASMTRSSDEAAEYGIEIQRWDLNVGQGELRKDWLAVTSTPANPAMGESIGPPGIRALMHADEIMFNEIVGKLSQERLELEGSGSRGDTARAVNGTSGNATRNHASPEQSREDAAEDKRRSGEEEDFVRRLIKVSTRIAVWTERKVWWAVRTPLILQLEGTLARYAGNEPLLAGDETTQQGILSLLGSVQGRDASTELEYLTLSYVRQRCGLLLLTDFLLAPDTRFAEGGVKLLEKVLLESGLDVRAVLVLIPAFSPYLLESQKGLWVYGGVRHIIVALLRDAKLALLGGTVGDLPPRVLQFFRHFLVAWRGRKGLPSVTNEGEVFQTVDAVLILVLLELDKTSARGLARSGSVRQELYELVDHGVDCFDVAVNLLQQYHRLYVLSRLYQGRKMSADVLGTWKRIVEGERDDGGELDDGEHRVREYLAKVSNQALVKEYGIWLATRNPKLGVQVFTDDKGRSPRFEPAEVVDLLRKEAPDAVKYYLEHLVFGKGNTSYVNELINYYLNVVVDDLQSSEESRATVLATYEAYRALQPPKPTYRQFLTDNAPEDDEVWQSRLRLLQLLGGAHDYDAAAIRARITSIVPTEPRGGKGKARSLDTIDPQQDSDLLVPETIILDGRSHRHEDALRLLVHRLGDYDTAVSYCLRGGASIYVATPGRKDSLPTRATQEHLFRTLLHEFLQLADRSERIQQSSDLLEGFAGYFDVAQVLEVIPDDWAVDAAASYLVSSLKRIVKERHESMVTRALSSAENLKVNYDLVVRIDELGPTIDKAVES